jgi:TATA-box binding protein (TBP) (component of TFIID and TFIIIB)
MTYRLELKTYNSVEREYHGIIWELDKFQCEYVLSNARVALHGCDNEDQLQKAVTKIASVFAQEVKKKILRLRDQLVLFIETNMLKEIMIQWKPKKNK